MQTILAIIGTRPEAIKMAPVIAALRARPDAFRPRVCVSGQHRQMLDQVLALFGIAPDHDLDIMRCDQSLGQLTARLHEGLEQVIRQERPDWVLVQGDTTTAMVGAQAAFYQGVRVGHVEAGLRTRDKRQPFPEEINRRIISTIADLHFAPTTWARDNLVREGTVPDDIRVTGNTVIDALQWATGLPYDPTAGPLAAIPWNRRIILTTCHRRENHGAPLLEICDALREIAALPDAHVVYPVHLSPHVQGPVRERLGDCEGITLLPPLDYRAFVYLLERCYLVITDSGGLQEEAPGLGKPVLVLRNRTERPEAIKAGTARLVGTRREQILDETRELLQDRAAYARMAQARNPYGDGHAAERIVQALSA